MKKGSTFALAFENKGRQTDKLSSSRRAKKSSLTDWNKVRNKTRQRGGRNHLRQIGFVKTSATSIPLYVY